MLECKTFSKSDWLNLHLLLLVGSLTLNWLHQCSVINNQGCHLTQQLWLNLQGEFSVKRVLYLFFMKLISAKADSQRQVEPNSLGTFKAALCRLFYCFFLQLENFHLYLTSIEVIGSPSCTEMHAVPLGMKGFEMDDTHGSSSSNHEIFFQTLAQA